MRKTAFKEILRRRSTLRSFHEMGMTLEVLYKLYESSDIEKIENILELLNPNVQTFITTTELNTFNFLKKFSYKEFEINNGQIVKESNHGK